MEELNAVNTLNHIINKYWNRLCSVLGVPLNERMRHGRLAAVDRDYHTALDSCIDYWITNDSNPSMDQRNYLKLQDRLKMKKVRLFCI